MSKINGGALFGRALANEGIEKAFVLTGGHVMPIFYGMRAAGIEIIDMRHECAAMYAANTYALATGKPAVVVTTAGPGVINTTAGMVTARETGIPVIHIGGAVFAAARDTGEMQDMSTLKLMESCAKWAAKVTVASRIPEYITLALRHATDSAPGPVYLEVPMDIPLVEMEESEVIFPSKGRTDAIPFGDPAFVDAAAGLLAHAERPAVVIGDAARFSMGDYAADITSLSDYLKMPLCVAGSACRGLFGDETVNPLLRRSHDGFAVTGKADVVLALGCRFDWTIAQGKIAAAGAKVIQVHPDKSQIGFNLRADIGISGGAGPVAHQLLAAIKSKRPEPVDVSPWVGELKTGIESLSDPHRAEGIPVHPGRCAGEVGKFLAGEGRDWNVSIDGGDASFWISNTAPARRPGQIFGEGQNIGMIGTGPANAIGAWVANRKPVLWYTGDGSFGFYAMELDTMARLGMQVVCVISNDSGWGLIRMGEEMYHAKEVEENGHCNVELEHMRAYEKMALMWGGHGERVTDPEEILPAIQRAVANGKPSIINVEVDQRFGVFKQS